ncbi:MAG: TonB-dependent receptor plug domain-containing protein [Chitinophagaceae bacterium]
MYSTIVAMSLATLNLANVDSIPASSSDTVRLMDEVVVSATRDRVAGSVLPYSVGVYTRRDIQRQVSRTIPEALSGMAGIHIQKTNHGGGSPFVRGLTGNQTLIMVDGIRMNNSVFRYGPNQYMTLVSPDIVDRIEVVKGSGSVSYGSDALTGVINILTTSIDFSKQPRWSGRVTGRLTSAGIEYSGRPEIRYEGRRFSMVAGASVRQFGDLLGGDTTGFQHPSGYRERSFDVKTLADLGMGWKMTLSVQHLQQMDVPVYHKYKLENFAVNDSDPIGRSFGYIRFEKPMFPSLDGKLTITGALQGMKEGRQLRKNGSSVLRVEEDKVQTRSGAVDLSLRFNPYWSSNSGAEVYADRVSSMREDQRLDIGTVTSLRGLYPNDATYLNAALYSMHHLEFGAFRLEGGVRYNVYRAAMTDVTLGSVTIKPQALVFQGGVNYRVASGWYLFAQASEGFRAPNIDDMGTLGIVDFRYEAPAFDLRPERSFNMEAGLKVHQPRFAVQASVFRTNLRDLITRIKTSQVISGYDVYRKENVDRGYIQGFEVQTRVEPLDGLRLTGAAATTYGQSITRNEPLRRMPPFTARLGAEYGKDRVFGGLIFDHASVQRRLEAGDKADNRIPKGGTPGFNILNAYGTLALNRLTLRAYLNNLFNTDHRTHGSGINGMGRSVSLTVLVDIR